MNFTTLYFTFFDIETATEIIPFTGEYYVDYKKMELDHEMFMAIDSKHVGYEILETTIKHENYTVKINSRYLSYGKTFFVELRVNEMTSYVSMNLEGGFGGSFQIEEGKGFHYSLIKNKKAIEEECKKLMKDRESRKQKKRKLP